ncbi:TPA: helix-turn-helix transcriptional regulator [Clostridioides difficile]|jgi:Predicted transcriptional regulators|uniref:Transcriptional regulator, HTH-type Tn1549-like,CTn2-Orf22 n=2 Tax=Clostridioides difficile TaxID=1496 RepID=Q188L5_CLOD6|nr:MULTISPECIES: helix-turn-helix transcriptional regulator [Bacillota]AJP10122.1 transcriptional regulator, HTH-type [Clostridioides difficile 630]ARE61330.1 transcriptional regulator, HTH-type [Clostridioides difficile]MBY2199734.1 helix-turn-helix transcriptional regulator [Clostridioides difficile]MCG6592467.1 transcriptional regulator [Clostridioides difficile]MCG6593275.1 transcriptional regulator [Clostridioides difficile]
MRAEMILKNRLKEERINFGISQKELAQLVGVSRQTINSIENEQFYPTTKLSLIICEVLEKRVEDVFYLCEMIEK